MQKGMIFIKTEQIIYLEDIAKTQSISQTAQRFFISQQALSFSLNKLEEEFGVTFLNRTNRGAELTQEGILFLEKSKSILATYRELKEDLYLHTADFSHKELLAEDSLTIYSHTRLLEPLLVSLLDQYTRKYPKINIQLYENENIDTIEAIGQQKGDFGLIFIPDFLVTENADYQFPDTVYLEQLFSDEFIICCSTNHPLKNRKSIRLKEISSVPTILFDTNANILTTKDNPLPPVSSHQYFSKNMAFHKALIRRGMAVSLITSFEFRKLYFKHKDITALPIIDSPKSVITLVTNTTSALSPAAQLFISMLKKYDFYGL